MENPEEILHSLEEFAKMKPKDIPRELEEYLKFVAKTGDPVYQWPAIKSLFREKLINVITEFYESCSSMEIPPCPNVEMFNYDLVKNFILEKLDTFASAPFTLQRICELLTSPRKEYTRIDKYMRALEKNILVVSTMEPGGRRTENADGVMNGIESDHEHVPEPGNEINVEEMDDSPSWPQNIQTNNHISEPISFDTPEQDFNVSTTNQEIVCVQYVSVEPLASDGLQIQSDEVKESDISVTITALNVKKDENQETLTSESESQPTIDILKETIVEKPSKQEIEKTESEIKMELQTIGPKESELKDISKLDGSSGSSDPLTENILLTNTSEQPSEEHDQVQAISESENAEIENVSPEMSVSPSKDFSSQSDASTDTLPKEVDLENTSSPEEALQAPESKSENLEIKENKQILEIDSPGDVITVTKVSDVDQIITEDTKVQESTELVTTEVESKETSLVHTEKADGDNSCLHEDTFETDSTKVSDSAPKTVITTEVLAQQVVQPTIEKATKEVTEEILITDTLGETQPEVADEIKSSEIPTPPEEKIIPMDIDIVPEDSLDSNDKEKTTLEESEMSETPV